MFTFRCTLQFSLPDRPDSLVAVDEVACGCAISNKPNVVSSASQQEGVCVQYEDRAETKAKREERGAIIKEN
jgi:hypothetical protein